MKICGYCGNEYDEREIECPVCGSKLLKHTKGAETAADEYRRIEEEFKNKRKSRSRILGIGVGGIVLIFLIISFSVVRYFNNPQRDIDKEAKRLYEIAAQQIKNEDYDAAIETLDDINASWSEYSKVEGKKIEAVKGQFASQIEKYNSTGEYESIITYINENIENVQTDTEISQIYNDAVQKYKGEEMKKVDEYIASNDYTSAKSVLLTAFNIIENDSEIEEKLTDVNQKEILQTVIKYENEQEYTEAIEYIYDNLESVENNSEILLKLSDCEQKYRESILNDAESTCQADGYEAAIKVIDQALVLLKNDEILLKEKNRYEAMAPVALVDLKAFHDDYGENKQVGISLNDKLGNSYLNCIEYMGGSSTFWGENIDTFGKRDIYVIKGEYTTFKATVFVPEERSSYWDTEISNENKRKGSFTLRIFGDGKLLYQSPLMITTQYPVEVDIDITGVEQLAFSWATFSDVTSEIGLANAYLYK